MEQLVERGFTVKNPKEWCDKLRLRNGEIEISFKWGTVRKEQLVERWDKLRLRHGGKMNVSYWVRSRNEKLWLSESGGDWGESEIEEKNGF